MMRFALALALSAACGIHALSEKEAILLALSRHPDIRIQAYALTTDSLRLAAAKSAARPLITLSGENAAEYHPAIREDNGMAATTHQEFSGNLKASASTLLPGGGSVSLSASNGYNRNPDSSRTIHASRLSLLLKQPLLQNAWGLSDAEVGIRVERNNLALSRKQFDAAVEQVLSDVRGNYWDWVLAERQRIIRETDLSYASQELENARTRLKLGVGTEMDTLSSALERLRALDNMVTAQYAERLARLTLLQALGLPDNASEAPADTEVQLAPLPPADSLRARAQRENPKLRLLDATRANLELQLKQSRNRLLPAMDVVAGVNRDADGTRPFTSNRASAFSPAVTDPYAGILFTYDLLSRNARISGRQVNASLQSNAAEREKASNTLALDVENLLAAWQEDSLRLTIRETEVRIAEKNFHQTEESFKLGSVDNLAMTKAKNDLINAYLNRLNAIVGLKKVEISVDRATGTGLRRFQDAAPTATKGTP
ncbi:MAG: TolC family protein [Fibrobacterota bacterium]